MIGDIVPLTRCVDCGRQVAAVAGACPFCDRRRSRRVPLSHVPLWLLVPLTVFTWFALSYVVPQFMYAFLVVTLAFLLWQLMLRVRP
jgi:hypothetical protein